MSSSQADNDTGAMESDDAPFDNSKTIEERYQKKTQLEHILLRPDTYIGTTEHQEEEMFVVDPDDDHRLVKRTVNYAPGLFKIFDEILVNAADNKQRDPSMDKLEVAIDADSNTISVCNNGKGIPIQMHKEEGVYVPTLVFGHLLTGSNFDDDQKKTTGGRNGYGAKLANVFSTFFQVECADVESGKYFSQIFRDNMTTADDPIVKDLTASQMKKGDFVRITFRPDLQRFHMTSLDQDIVGLFGRRAYDVAASLTLKQGKQLTVTLNGKKLPIKSFKDYIKCHDKVNEPVAFESTERWEVGVSLSDDGNGSISFVNSIATTKGGKHVDYVTDQIIAHLIKTLKKKKVEVAKSHIKPSLFVFVNCLIENPAFDSQTKECLTTKPRQFGSKCELSPKFLKAVDKSEIVDSIVQYSQFKNQKKLKSTGGRKRIKLTGIPKLDDANFAGSAKSKDCTLIITEGDSAKSLAMAGLSVVGRDYYGVFPLRGKPLNVRDAKQTQVLGNEEIKNLVNILGLKYDVVYTEDNIKTLRYGHLMIMADQDTDGSHIKGLVVNFIHFYWPSLLDVPGFLQQFITPIVKASKGKSLVKTFFNVPEYEQWLESTGNNGRGWTIKYYKGLGTSTSAEAKEYFSNLERHEITFAKLSSDGQANNDDPETLLPDVVQSGSDMIDMVFRKDRVEDRKKWLESTEPDTFLDYTTSSVKQDGIRYSDFINKEFALFSAYDNSRSIPHIIDGFKPSQRKVLFGCFRRKLKGEVKVAQLTGYIAEHSSYHHGEASLQGTIVAMASSFVGANNVNLLAPCGQFGTRRMGGKDAASARYIFTKLEAVTRTIFHPDDDALLNYLNDDGASIEPDYYVPVIPMVLVNGADGIGSGWSTRIPNYNPRDIIANIRRLIAGEEAQAMVPFYQGFTGEITPKGGGKYIVNGKIERVDESTLVISELPIRTWTQSYKEFLDKLSTNTEKQAAVLDDFKENHTETTVHFTITASKEKIDEWEQQAGGLAKLFKLTGSLSTSNMVAFHEKKLTRFKSAEDILGVFFGIRLECYTKRKELLVKCLEIEQLKLSNKARFVEEVCSGELVVSNRQKVEILDTLKQQGYDTFLDSKTVDASELEADDNSANDDETPSMSEMAKGYEYLLGMKIWALTFEKAKALQAELDSKTAELETLKATSPKTIWLNDLIAVEKALDERDAAIAAAALEEKEARVKSNETQQSKTKRKRKKPTSRKRKGDTEPGETPPRDSASNKRRLVSPGEVETTA